jgi:predicted AlkP superfamily pyrophosphatase or phosphodiesterase
MSFYDPKRKQRYAFVAWLHLPSAQRPHFITLYYSNVDHAGHEFGPDSPQAAEGCKTTDQWTGLALRGPDTKEQSVTEYKSGERKKIADAG